jgi:16S rRNA (uracil1498-N3)-methyltransferase
MPRFFCPTPLVANTALELPAATARHVQVLRLQPGMPITLFNGEGGEWSATVLRMGRSDVEVMVLEHQALEREVTRAVWLAAAMPANDRMDWLVEKATELGVAGIQPLHTAHSVLRLSAERAAKKQAHWQAVAVAACEQCGGNRVPTIAPVLDGSAWLAQHRAPSNTLRCVLSLSAGTRPLTAVLAEHPRDTPLFLLSGPEGGLSPTEDEAARQAGWQAVSLGPRVLRAETAALTGLSWAIAH